MKSETLKKVEDFISNISSDDKNLLEKYFQDQEKNKNKIIRKKFTIEEDNLLINLVNNSKNIINWDKISLELENRSARQCKDRWNNYLSPNINKSEWTLEEDKILIEKQKEYGPKWVLISQFFKNRTDISVKNRWISLMRKL